MKRLFSQGLLWLYLLKFGVMVLSLEPGYLDFDNLPETNFTCVGKVIGGYYADLETNCQMFHVCTIGQLDEPMDIRFLCLNGTVFDQETRVCERIDEVDCTKSEQFYSLNLELYGNSGPILEETPETVQGTEAPSLIIKSTSPSTSSSTTRITTTSKRPHKHMNTPYYSTTGGPTSPPSASSSSSSSPSSTRQTNKPKGIGTVHHFPVNPDIRFNPEEINISLNPGAPPDIRTKHYLSQSYSDKVEEEDDYGESGESSGSHEIQKSHVSSTTTSPKTLYSVDVVSDNRNRDTSYEYVEDTEPPPRKSQQQFLIETNSFRHSQSYPPNVNHDSFNNQQQYHSTTSSNRYPENYVQSTTKTVYIHPPKPPTVHQHHHYTLHSRTEKTPQRLQIPIPLIPTLTPLTFSSPSPFTLRRHIGTKRYTKDHQHNSLPRIVISASASVSDASGRRLNYSLGTIDAGEILDSPPASYDDYKDRDVRLDPFYHDVPKLKPKRRKRRNAEIGETKVNPFDIIRNEQEAMEVLKFLFTWYQSHQATATEPTVTIPVASDLIHAINYELSSKAPSLARSNSESLNSKVSDIFSNQDNRFGGYENIGTGTKKYPNVYKKTNSSNDRLETLESQNNTDNMLKHQGEDLLLENNVSTDKMNTKNDNFSPYDYVDDNYEGTIYKQKTAEERKLSNINIDNETDNKTEEPSSHNESNPDAAVRFFEYFDTNRNNTRSLTTGNIESTSEKYDMSSSYTLKTPPLESEISDEIPPIAQTNVHEDPNKVYSSTTSSLEIPLTPDTKRRKSRGRSREKQSNQVRIEDPEAILELKSRRSRHRGRSKFNVLNTSPSTVETVTFHSQKEKNVEVTDSITILPEISHPSPFAATLPTLNVINEFDLTQTENVTKSNISVTITESIPINETAATESSDSGQNNHTETKAEIYKETASFPATTQHSLTTHSAVSSTASPKIDSISESSVTQLHFLDNEFLERKESTTTANTRSQTYVHNPKMEIPHMFVKLLKHYVDAAQMEFENAYEPITENYLPISTESENDYITSDSPTELPTLKGLFYTGQRFAVKDEPPDHLANNKFEAPASNSEFDHDLSKTESSSDLSLTTATTPFLSFDELQSFGTIFSDPTPASDMVRDHLNETTTEERQIGTKPYIPESTTANYLEDDVTETIADNSTKSVTRSETTTDSSAKRELGETTTFNPFTESEIDSFPLLLWQTTLDIIRNAQQGNLIPIIKPGIENIPEETFSTSTVPSTFMTTESLKDFIEEIENGTKSIVVTEDQLRYSEKYESSSEVVTETTADKESKLDVDNNATEILFVKDTDFPEPSTITTTSSSVPTTTMGSKSNINSSHLVEVMLETSTVAKPQVSDRTKPFRRKSSNRNNHIGRHRFNTQLLTEQEQENISVAPLYRSATPTRSEDRKFSSQTTPLSSSLPPLNYYHIKTSKRFVFNCFGKAINRFYSDPRDCRLFHYCTKGYSRNQLLDLKYVCDQKTYFDDEKLICTKNKPGRCL